MRKLELETREQRDKTVSAGPLMVNPMVDEDYWTFRVRLGDQGQAIVAFPKYGGYGCGFAQEEDWNTNLPVPYSSPEEVYDHIIHNKGDDPSISHGDVLMAIRMVHDAAAKASDCKRRDAS